MWQIPQIWKGGECWILGGGASMPRQFGIPEQVIEDVITKKIDPSAYSPYLSVLHDKHVIAVNAAYLLGDWMDIIFFGDHGFYLTHRDRMYNHPAIKVYCGIGNNPGYNIRRVSRYNKYGITEKPGHICWNGNSGGAAINLAAHTGVKRIILLGFDMTLDSNNNQHWHGIYKSAEQNKKLNGKKRTMPFNIHLRCFPQMAKDAKRMGIEILNASPDSMITEFRKITVKELLWKT